MKLKMKSFLLPLSVLTLSTGLTLAQSPEQKGYDIAAKSDRSDRGFKDSEAVMEMILTTRSGKSSSRKLSQKTLEIPDESVGDKSIIVFSSPRDIKNTALLSHSKMTDPDDQWLYLPALKRVKRISSVNKSGPFVGSEFAFEDFTSLELNKYSYKWLKEEAYDGKTCDVIERYPKYEHSGYTKQISWIDQKFSQVRKVEFYNRRGALMKTLELKDYKRYAKKFWRAHLLEMANHQTGKKTSLVYGTYKFGNGLSDKNFISSVLSR